MTGHADRSLLAAGKRFVKAKRLDAAAALTYYSMLSMFPAILVGTSLIGLLDPGATEALLEGVEEVTPEDGYRIIEAAVEGLQTNPATAGVMALIGLAAALWASSNYVAAFSRAMNAVYRVTDERPWWMVLVVRIALTLVVGALTAFAALTAATGGAAAAALGSALGVPGTAVTVWEYAKWPLVLLVVAFIVALLYWLAPARTDPFRRRVPGAALAVVLWVVASAGFGLYVGNFGNYDRTYGTLGGVIVFLIWLWLTNGVLLFGAEYNASAMRPAAGPEEPEGGGPEREDDVDGSGGGEKRPSGSEGPGDPKGPPGAQGPHVPEERSGPEGPQR